MSLLLTTAAACGLAASGLLVACGGEERLDESDLPDRLADALPRLERAGYEVDPVAARVNPLAEGATEIPVLIVKEDDGAVVLATGPGVGRVGSSGLATHVRDASGQTFEANLQTICGPDEYIAETRGARDLAERVLRISGFCGA